ncbi:phage tail spike protein [Lactococcus chungangensis]|uniref:phage tail spike protein n=1 Tax=Pseudolactococcus chungangensis TaxID=451457 RepID=UPI003735D4D1
MQFHILDENSNPVAIMDNTLSEAIHLKNSKFQSFATGSANYLDFEIDKLHVDSSMFQVGYWIVFKHRGKDQKLYINNVEEAEKDTLMQISAKSANLDLNIEKITPPAPMTAQPITWYFNIILSDTGYTIGTNELSNLTRKLSWDSEEMTRRTLLQSVANQFDKGELEYEEILNSDFTTKERLVHIKKQVGEIRDDIELEYGKNVKTIKRATNIDNMCTAVRPTTTNKDGKVTTIVNEPDWQVLDDDGNIKFYHKKGSEIIFAPIANARYGNRGTNVTSGGYILHKINYENISSSETFTRGKTYIEEYSVPEITYEAEGRTDANPGDTVTIIDEGYNPPLLLSARVLDITYSFDDPTLEGANFGNYKALESQISSDLQDKMAALAEQNAPYSTTTLTTNGVQFKNSQGSTVLTARLFKGTKEIVPDSYIWTKDNTELSSTTNTITVSASDVDEKSVYRWDAVISGVSVAFDEVTITDVSDGTNGISPINLVIESSNGYQFKNNIINTTFTAILYQNNKEIDSDSTQFSYVWSKTNADGTADTAWNLAHQSSQKSITISNSDVSQRATFNCTAEPLS